MVKSLSPSKLSSPLVYLWPESHITTFELTCQTQIIMSTRSLSMSSALGFARPADDVGAFSGATGREPSTTTAVEHEAFTVRTKSMTSSPLTSLASTPEAFFPRTFIQAPSSQAPTETQSVHSLASARQTELNEDPPHLSRGFQGQTEHLLGWDTLFEHATGYQDLFCPSFTLNVAGQPQMDSELPPTQQVWPPWGLAQTVVTQGHPDETPNQVFETFLRQRYAAGMTVPMRGWRMTKWVYSNATGRYEDQGSIDLYPTQALIRQVIRQMCVNPS